ncbi:MAG: hypothetical protein HY858_02170 [Candidatus Solibacter usitatus]|nr:hypothetical protein [Candidatus Solibacter usitatus]
MLVYLGLLAAAGGTLSLLRPLPGIHTRRRALVLFLLGWFAVAAGVALPAGLTQDAGPPSELDRFVPSYQFSELHSIRIRAPAAQVYRAIKSVTAGEIFLFQTLTAIRRLGLPGPESILHAPERQPLLDVATRTTFILLADHPGREVVIGTFVQAPPGWRRQGGLSPNAFQDIRGPGFAVAGMNFVVRDAGPGESIVTTETRVHATDAASARRFAAYWRVIYPGSALIRRMWLRAIARRAETASVDTQKGRPAGAALAR